MSRPTQAVIGGMVVTTFLLVIGLNPYIALVSGIFGFLLAISS